MLRTTDNSCRGGLQVLHDGRQGAHNNCFTLGLFTTHNFCQKASGCPKKQSGIRWEVELFANYTKSYNSHKPHRPHITIPKVRPGGVSVMLCGCFSAPGPERLLKVKLTRQIRQILQSGSCDRTLKAAHSQYPCNLRAY